MAKSLKERVAQESPDIEENLTLVAFGKQKGTDAQPGYRLILNGPLGAGAVTPGNTFDPKLPQHGIMKITSRNLFEGVQSVTMTGKLLRKLVAPQKDSPARQTWTFRLANEPTRDDAIRLLDLARANGDATQGAVEVVFKQTDEPKAEKEPDGPELFGEDDDEATEIENIKNGNVKVEDFDEDAESNTREGSDADEARKGRKRKVSA